MEKIRKAIDEDRYEEFYQSQKGVIDKRI